METTMAGHSKWANIQHRKKAQDTKRGKLFTRFIKEVTIAVKQGGGPDPAGNARLRLALEKAVQGNVPKDTITRAVKRASGEGDGSDIEEIRYEGYGPGGVAVMVECVTDNRNRTVGEVRHAFSKCGGNLGTDGSVAYMFNKVGQFSYPADINEDQLMEAALEAGADDVVANDDGSMDVLTDPDAFSDVRDALAAAALETEDAEITMRPTTNISLDANDAEKMVRLLETLDDLDDVQEVYSNADISEEILATL
jgi:YebC/PmpR family DNA-binding regulatory protein